MHIDDSHDPSYSYESYSIDEDWLGPSSQYDPSMMRLTKAGTETISSSSDCDDIVTPGGSEGSYVRKTGERSIGFYTTILSEPKTGEWNYLNERVVADHYDPQDPRKWIQIYMYKLANIDPQITYMWLLATVFLSVNQMAEDTARYLQWSELIDIERYYTTNRALVNVYSPSNQLRENIQMFMKAESIGALFAACLILRELPDRSSRTHIEGCRDRLNRLQLALIYTGICILLVVWVIYIPLRQNMNWMVFILDPISGVMVGFFRAIFLFKALLIIAVFPQLFWSSSVLVVALLKIVFQTTYIFIMEKAQESIWRLYKSAKDSTCVGWMYESYFDTPNFVDDMDTLVNVPKIMDGMLDPGLCENCISMVPVTLSGSVNFHYACQLEQFSAWGRNSFSYYHAANRDTLFPVIPTRGPLANGQWMRFVSGNIRHFCIWRAQCAVVAVLCCFLMLVYVMMRIILKEHNEPIQRGKVEDEEKEKEGKENPTASPTRAISAPPIALKRPNAAVNLSEINSDSSHPRGSTAVSPSPITTLNDDRLGPLSEGDEEGRGESSSDRGSSSFHPLEKELVEKRKSSESSRTDLTKLPTDMILPKLDGYSDFSVGTGYTLESTQSDTWVPEGVTLDVPMLTSELTSRVTFNSEDEHLAAQPDLAAHPDLAAQPSNGGMSSCDTNGGDDSLSSIREGGRARRVSFRRGPSDHLKSSEDDGTSLSFLGFSQSEESPIIIPMSVPQRTQPGGSLSVYGSSLQLLNPEEASADGMSKRSSVVKRPIMTFEVADMEKRGHMDDVGLFGVTLLPLETYKERRERWSKIKFSVRLGPLLIVRVTMSAFYPHIFPMKLLNITRGRRVNHWDGSTFVPLNQKLKQVELPDMPDYNVADVYEICGGMNYEALPDNLSYVNMISLVTMALFICHRMLNHHNTAIEAIGLRNWVLALSLSACVALFSAHQMHMYDVGFITQSTTLSDLTTGELFSHPNADINGFTNAVQRQYKYGEYIELGGNVSLFLLAALKGWLISGAGDIIFMRADRTLSDEVKTRFWIFHRDCFLYTVKQRQMLALFILLMEAASQTGYMMASVLASRLQLPPTTTSTST